MEGLWVNTLFLCLLGIFLLVIIDMVCGGPIRLRLEAILFKRRLIYLQDGDGEITLSIRRKSPFGGYVAPRYPYSNLRTVTLKDNGDIENGSYVKKWTYKDKK